MGGNGRGLLSSITKWLSKGLDEDPYQPPQKRTWAEKVTDESNAWLSARRLEAMGDMQEAARAYAKDAEFWMEKENYARAALSTACEARCSARVGMDGSIGYKLAGDLYMQAGKVALRENPHTAVQIFDRAKECYELSGDERDSEEVETLLDAVREDTETTGNGR